MVLDSTVVRQKGKSGVIEVMIRPEKIDKADPNPRTSRTNIDRVIVQAVPRRSTSQVAATPLARVTRHPSLHFDRRRNSAALSLSKTKMFFLPAGQPSE